VFAVGAAPPRWLVARGQHDTRVAVTGYVADERPYFERTAALILPVHNGGGSRLKALVAMARGLPIISTRLGMEGLEAEPSVHFLEADTAEEWVEAVRRLLADADLRRKLACNARALVAERYDWSALAPRVHAAYAWLRP
jgi:glycosyltransferase involved in cell wall biosynthesis